MKRWFRHPLLLLLVVYAAYAGGFIWNVSYEIQGKRYFFLFDDAMISMRYARNLAEGNGLVWNPGEERVEGFTNPLWTLMMAGTHLLPLPMKDRGLPVEIIAALILLANILVIYQLAMFLSGENRTAAMIAAVFTAFFFPLNHWAYLGMEVSLMTLLVSLSAWLALLVWKRGVSPWLLYIFLATATTVRIDAAVWGVVILGFLWWVDTGRRRQHLLTGASVLVGAVLLQIGLQAWYYGDIFPNTYYLKMTGYPFFWRILRGAVETLSKAGAVLGPLLIITFAVSIRQDDRQYLLLAVYGSLLAYSIYVGGDAWEWWGETNRYVTAGVPVVFALFGAAFVTVREWLHQRWNTPVARRLLNPLLWVLVGCLFLVANKRGDWRLMREAVFLKKPLQVEEHRKILQTALTLDSLVTKDAKVAVVWAGIMPYVLDRPMIDLLGKNDARIAHQPMHIPASGLSLVSFYPGHMKYDYPYSIGKLQPDVIAGFWGSWTEAEQAMEGRYEKLVIEGNLTYLKRSSNQILWDKVAEVRDRENH